MGEYCYNWEEVSEEDLYIPELSIGKELSFLQYGVNNIPILKLDEEEYLIFSNNKFMLVTDIVHNSNIGTSNINIFKIKSILDNLSSYKYFIHSIYFGQLLCAASKGYNLNSILEPTNCYLVSTFMNEVNKINNLWEGNFNLNELYKYYKVNSLPKECDEFNFVFLSDYVDSNKVIAKIIFKEYDDITELYIQPVLKSKLASYSYHVSIPPDNIDFKDKELLLRLSIELLLTIEGYMFLENCIVTPYERNMLLTEKHEIIYNNNFYNI